MTTTDYSISKTVKNNPEEAFSAITDRIPDWWSREFEGAGNQVGGSFTVRFGSHDQSYKTMKIVKLEAGKEVVWECTDAFINLPDLSNKKEWIGTKIVWSIYKTDEGSMITLTHEGLTTSFECYEICEAGWNSFFSSLVKLLVTGTGTPYSH